MRTYLFLLGFISLLTFTANSQNLVPNPGFENYTGCPSSNQFPVSNWFNPNTATPDYFNPCGTGSNAPPAVLFGPQTAHTGSSFAGAGWYSLGGGFYDYMQVQLTSPMVASTIYSLSMWVALAGGVQYASDDIGMYISNYTFKSTAGNAAVTNSVVATTPSGFGVFNTFVPQLKAANGSYITSTAWTLISGTYTAVGGENAITLGCFENWNTTGTSLVNPSGNGRCYYFFDDISIDAISTVTTAPAQPIAISGPTTACLASAQAYSVAPVGGASSYSWTLPNGWTGTSATNLITVTTNSTGGTLSVSAVNSIGASAVQTLAINLYTFQPTVSQVNTSLQTTVTGTYQWVDCANNYSVLSTAGATFTPAQNGNYAVIITQNGCADMSPCTSITVSPLQPGLIAGASTICPNAVRFYSIAPVTNAVSYTWSLPIGWTGTSTTNTINVTPDSASGTLSVSAVNTAGSSVTRTLSVYVNNFQATVTQLNTSLQTTVAGTYQWIDCANNFAILSTGSASFAPAQSGNYGVIVNQNGCADTSVCTAIILAPLQPGAITGSSTLCAGATQVFSVAPVTDAVSYIWNLPAGWIGSSSTTNISVTVTASGGILSVSANNAAGQSPVQTTSITINSAVAVLTKTNNVLHSAAADAYTWLDCNKNFSVVATAVQSYTPATSGSYAVLVSQNGCVDTSACVTVSLTATALAEIKSEMNFEIFPNPADGSVFIAAPKADRASLVVITDHIGKTVYEAALPLISSPSSFAEIKTDALAPGIYFIQLYSNGKTSAGKKIIIHH